MCRVKIELRGPLARHAPPDCREGRIILETPYGFTVRDVLNLIGIPEESVGLVLINGQKSRLSTCPAGGDTITFFPPVAGG